MCTAITYNSESFYFGRTLDYEKSFGEKIVVTPRNFTLKIRNSASLNKHYAIVGMACVADDFPLYYDAVNEHGLCMAGLNFVGNAMYFDIDKNKNNIAYFELIPYILGTCKSIDQAKQSFENINITNINFSKDLPKAFLHWIIADKKESIVVESTVHGISIYNNPVGVLTNNPEFDKQIFNLNNYMSLSNSNASNKFSDKLNLHEYSRGMGAIGLPGDLSSMSRFVRASFTKLNSCTFDTESESVNQFFHILSSVSQTKGCCKLESGEYEYTIYTSCCNASKGVYYYTTYQNPQICGVTLTEENINLDKLLQYDLLKTQKIVY